MDELRTGLFLVFDIIFFDKFLKKRHLKKSLIEISRGKLFQKLDNYLLRLTERFIKRFNWLTGKDNFWLARRFAFWGVIFSSFSFLLMGDLVFSIIILLYIPLFLLIVYGKEEIDEKDALRGVKNSRIENMLLSLRVYSACFTGLLCCFSLLLFANKIFIILFPVIFGFWGSAFLTLTFYLISIRKPPYKRSQAEEWLKRKVTELKESFEPTPEPIPIKR